MSAGLLPHDLKDRLNHAAEHSQRHTVDAALNLLATVENDRVQSAYVARVLEAVTQMVDGADEGALIDALGAPSDFGVLVQMLEQPDVLERLRARDPLAPARIRGLRAKEQLLAAEGGTLSVQEVAALLGLTRQAVDKRRKAGKLLAVTPGKHWHVFPAWQFGESGVLPGWEVVLTDLAEHSPWAIMVFMLSWNTLLNGETPLSVLRRGEFDRVRHAAQLFGEQTAL